MLNTSLVSLSVVIILGVCALGCGSREELNEKKAIALVQDYVPPGSRTSIQESIKVFTLAAENATSRTGDGWAAAKSGDGVYRVTFRSKLYASGNELLFGVDIVKGKVIGLNRNALALTQP